MTRVAVVGTGANGGAVAADLTRAGIDVLLIEQWPDHVETMRRDGLLVELPDGEQTTPVDVIHLCQVAELRRTEFDVVLLGVKAYDTRWACELVRPVLSSDAAVVGLQNGMTIDAVADVLGPRHTVGAVIEIAANLFTPGLIERQTGPADTWFAVGAYEGGHPRVEQVAELLRHAGIVEVTDDIRSAKWMKLVANAAEVIPSALLNLPLADAVAVPGIRAVMEQAGREAMQTALALGCRRAPIFGKSAAEVENEKDYAVALFAAVLKTWTLPTTRVALLHDWMKGRRGEVEDFNGAVVAAQARLGGRAPVNEGLVALARQVESGALKPDPSNAPRLLALLEPLGGPSGNVVSPPSQ